MICSVANAIFIVLITNTVLIITAASTLIRQVMCRWERSTRASRFFPTPCCHSSVEPQLVAVLLVAGRQKGWGLSAKLGKHSAIWGKLGTALHAYTLNPCTKFPTNPTSRKVNTWELTSQHCLNSSMYAYIYCIKKHKKQRNRTLKQYRHTCYCSNSAEMLTLKCWLY